MVDTIFYSRSLNLISNGLCSVGNTSGNLLSRSVPHYAIFYIMIIL